MSICSDTYHRSILKTLSYRIIGALITALIVFALTRRLALAIGVGAVSLVAKTILYYLHESLWAFIDPAKSEEKQNA